jgi:hypothetical protein
MIECRGCGKNISLDCPYCPHCGKPCGMRTYVATSKPKPTQKIEKPAIKVALFAAVGLFTIILWQLFSRVNDASQTPADQKAAQTTSLTP